MINLFQRRAALGLAATLTTLALPAMAAAQTGGTGSIAFTESPELSPTAQALPRFVGDTAEIQAINADLAVMDARDAEAFGNCPNWTRNVSTPMTGPAYVTVGVNQDKSCGGPFEGVDLLAVSYDLATGEQLDWFAALPRWSPAAGTGADYGLWSSPALSEWFSHRLLDNPDQDPEYLADCGGLFQPAAYASLKFKISLDAEQDSLLVMAVQPVEGVECFAYAYVRDEELQAVGLDPAVIEALHAAHAAENWDNGASRPGGALAAN